MVERDLVARGLTDRRVLEAMGTVPRERFIADHLEPVAYDDHPLRIGQGQTISQPYMVAVMAESAELTPTSRVLEIGTGSGYGAAILAALAGEVWTIERHEGLAAGARERLQELDCDNVHVIEGDGTLGLPDEAPFDAIVVTAGAIEVPGTLRDQLADGGRMIVPVGRGGHQRLLRVRRTGDAISIEELGPVAFVPLIGEGGGGTPGLK
jgi:protein-L-isoaspartate(D-aspartate) O-methyltransferase